MTPNDSSLPEQALSEIPIHNPEPVELREPAGEIDPDNPPWAASRSAGLWRSFLVWFGSILCLVVMPLILVVPYIVYRSVTQHVSMEEIMADKMVIFLSILGGIPAHLVTLLIVWAVVTQWGHYPFWKTVGLSWMPKIGPWTTVVVSGGLAVVLLAIGGVVTNLYGGEKTQLDQLINSSIQARLATVFLAFFTGPLVEELVYRGVLYPALSRIVGVAGAVALVSIMFAGVHVMQYKNNIAVIGVIAMLSVVLTLVRAYSHRLLPSFIIHLIFNGLQALFLILQPLFEKSDQSTPPAAPAIAFVTRILQHLM